jgi:hypothetical protein
MKSKQKTIQALYFASDDNKLRYGDGRAIEVGKTHTVEGDIELCSNGLHASKRPIDALKYAPGSKLYLVELSGTIVEGKDKLAASSRKYLASYDAEELLRAFARKAALINIELIKPYCETTEDYDLIVKYLTTGKESLRDAARSAAESAEYAASAARSDLNQLLLDMLNETTGWNYNE